MNKIQGHKNDLYEKETKIVELEYTIEKKDIELGKIDEIVAEKMKVKMKEVEREIQGIRE